MKKRILAIILSLALLFCFVPQLTSPAYATEITYTAQDPVRYGWQVLQQKENADNLLYVYETVVNGIACCETKITFDLNRSVPVDDLHMVVDMIQCDYPEFFWFYNYSFSYSGNVASYIKPHYTMTGETLENAKAAIEENAALLLTGLEDKSDYEISKLLHDRLAAFMSYEFSDNDQTIYGALAERQAVCAGYSRAYQYLLQQAGIPAWYIRGTAINSTITTPVAHAWTLVCLDGNWYYTDVTWDDQGSLDRIYYCYMNVTTEFIEVDHFVDDFYTGILPDCSSTDASYFAREGLILSSFDKEAIKAGLQESNLQIRVQITGNADQFVSDWYDNAGSIIQEMGLHGSYSYGLRYLDPRCLLLYITNRDAQPAVSGITFSSLPDKLVYEGNDTLDVSGGVLNVYYNNKTSEQVPITTNMISGFDPSVTGKQVLTVTYQGCKEYFTIERNSIATPQAPSGDFNGDNTETNADVIALMWHVLFPIEHPVAINADINHDGSVDNNDVIVLMWHILFPEENPLA